MRPRMSSTSSMASYWCAKSMNIRHSFVLDSEDGLRFLYNSPITSVNTNASCHHVHRLTDCTDYCCCYYYYHYFQFLFTWHRLLWYYRLNRVPFQSPNQQCQITGCSAASTLYFSGTDITQYTYLFELYSADVTRRHCPQTYWSPAAACQQDAGRCHVRALVT